MNRSTGATEAPEVRASSYFLWQAPGKPLSVHLNLEVVNRLEREILESFKAITKRGSEVGGLLLGRVVPGRSTVVVEDYEAVSCDYARGPLYLLAEPDKTRLAAAVQRAQGSADKGLTAVGFFRGNTRKDLAMDEEDQALMRELFSAPHQVCLLVRPFSMRPSVAGFFIWEGQRMEGQSSYLQFPFRRSELTKEEFAKAIVGGDQLAAGAPPATSAPVDGAPAAAAPKREARITIPLLLGKREEPAPPPAIPKREEPAPPPPLPRPEARAPFTPAIPKREEPAPPPPLPKPAARWSFTTAIPKREAPGPPPAPPKPEARAPLSPVIPKREEPAPPPPKPKTGPRSPFLSVIPRDDELAPPPPKTEARAPFTPVTRKREEPAPPPPKQEVRPAVTPVGLKREEPAPPSKPEARVSGPAVASGPGEPAKPEVAAPPPLAAGKREEPTPPLPPKPEEPAVTEALALGAEGKRRKLLYVIASAAAVVLIGVGGAVYLRPYGVSPASTAPGADASSLALRVERNAGQLLLSWNREARLIQSAQKAVLSISDGDHTEDIELDLGQLRSGSIVYSPITNDVSFRLEVTGAQGKSVNESVRVIAGRPSPAAPLGQAPPAPEQTTPPEPTPRQEPPPAQPANRAPESAAGPSPTPGGGVEPPAPAKLAAAETAPPPRSDSLATRLSAPQNLPEPPRLQSQSIPVVARPVETSSTPPPPATEVTKPVPQQTTPVAAQEPPSPARSAPAQPVQAPAPSQPLRVGGNVQQAKLISSVTPVYPPLARQARVSGVVRVEATIGRDGKIVGVAAVSGPPLLRQAAMDAVRRWIYRPTLLNGQPVEVVTQVDVTFNLNR